MTDAEKKVRVGQVADSIVLIDEDGLWILSHGPDLPGPVAAMEMLAAGETDALDDHFGYMSADTSPDAFEKITAGAETVAERAPDGATLLLTGLMNNPARHIFGLPTRHPEMPSVVQSDGTLEARDADEGD